MRTSLGTETTVATFILTYEPGELEEGEVKILATVDLRKLRHLIHRTRWSNVGKATGEHGAIVVERIG